MLQASDTNIRPLANRANQPHRRAVTQRPLLIRHVSPLALADFVLKIQFLELTLKLGDAQASSSYDLLLIFARPPAPVARVAAVPVAAAAESASAHLELGSERQRARDE